MSSESLLRDVSYGSVSVCHHYLHGVGLSPKQGYFRLVTLAHSLDLQNFATARPSSQPDVNKAR